MGTTVLLILIVAVVVTVIAYRVILARRGRIRSLSPENKARYAQSWSAIQARFLAQPAAAVQEADQLAVSILRDRGAKMNDGWRPAEMQRARELARASEGDSATEDLATRCRSTRSSSPTPSANRCVSPWTPSVRRSRPDRPNGELKRRAGWIPPASSDDPQETFECSSTRDSTCGWLDRWSRCRGGDRRPGVRWASMRS